MGSEKYPAENGFDAFLKKHGGSDNASTDCERTIFQFDVQRKYFREALDRWDRLLNLHSHFSRETLSRVSRFFCWLIIFFKEVFTTKREKTKCSRVWLSSSRSGLWLTVSCRSVRGSFLLEHEFSGVPLLRRPASCVRVDGSLLSAICRPDGRSTGSLKISTSPQPPANRPTDVLAAATSVPLVFFRARGNTTDEETPAGWISQVQWVTSE